MNQDQLSQLSDAVKSLYNLVKRLRGPGGCPWDAKQNNTTLKMYMLEEAYEVLDALENGTPDDVCQELGDLIFQIVFLSIIAEENKEYDLIDVLTKITNKM